MGALATAVRTRHDHHLRLIRARATTDELFQILRDDAFYERPIAERHRVIFYLGHVEAFDWNLLGQRAFGLRRFHSSFDRLFAFGIDPVGSGLPTDQPGDWPSRAEISEYKQDLRTQLDSAIDRALEHPSEGRRWTKRSRFRRRIIGAHREFNIAWWKFPRGPRHWAYPRTIAGSDGTTSAAP